MILFVGGTIMVLIFLLLASIQTSRMLDRIPMGVNLLLLSGENLARAILIIFSVALGLISGLPFQTLGWRALSSVSDVILGAGTGLVISVALPGLTLIAIRLFGPQVYNPRLVREIIPRTRTQWVLVPLVLAPAVFLEELLFRSYLIGGFSVLAPTLLLVVASSLAFGAAHSAQGALGIVAAIGLGMLLAALFLITSSLFAPFIAHYVINVAQITWAARSKSFWETLSRLSFNHADSRSDL